jgi:hypothetical protein
LGRGRNDECEREEDGTHAGQGTFYWSRWMAGSSFRSGIGGMGS